MKELQIKRVSITSLGNLVGYWYAIVGLVVGLVSGITTTVSIIDNNPQFTTATDVIVAIGVVLGGIIFTPLLFFVWGWLQGAVFAILFDFISRNTGGIKVTVDEKSIK